MGNLSFSIVVLLATTMAVFSAHSVVAHGDVHALCAKTDYPILCNSLLRRGVNGLPGLTQAAIHETVAQATHAKSLADGFSKTSFNANVKSTFTDCSSSYSDAIDNLMTVMKNARSKDIASMKINLSAVLTAVDDCNTSVQELPSAMPLVKINDLLKHLTDNCFALADLIGH